MRLILFAIVGLTALNAWTSQQEKTESLRCFIFAVELPDRDVLPEEEELLIGCYAQLKGGKQELAFIRDKDELDLLTTSLITKYEGRVSLSHFSMSAKEIKRVEQENYELNPLPIPSTLGEALHDAGNRGEIRELVSSPALVNSMNEVLGLYENSPYKVVKLSRGDKRIYDEEVYLPDEKLPTDGYWWPHIGLPLARDQYSPLAKYDAYVQAASGKNPNTVGWERSRHASQVSWAGHCNGWASASILYGYDDFNLRDEANNTVITSSDLQGMRSVLSYCTRNAFYGKRNNGRWWDDINDIYPHRFHNLLTYYIRDLEKAIAYDYRNDPSVDNHLISGYKTKFQKTDEEGKWLVETTLRAHSYSWDDFVHERRVAPTYEKTYWYYLWEDRNGNFNRGQWMDSNDHPDFVWVPLSESRCGYENPRFQESWFKHMLENLERI